MMKLTQVQITYALLKHNLRAPKKAETKSREAKKNQQRIPPRSNVIIYVHFRLYNEHPAQWLSIHVDDVHLCESKHYYHWAINHRARKKK